MTTVRPLTRLRRHPTLNTDRTTPPRLEALEARAVPTAGYFRAVSYNIASSMAAPATGLDTILQAIGNEHVNGQTEPIDSVCRALPSLASTRSATQASIRSIRPTRTEFSRSISRFAAATDASSDADRQRSSASHCARWPATSSAASAATSFREAELLVIAARTSPASGRDPPFDRAWLPTERLI